MRKISQGDDLASPMPIWIRLPRPGERCPNTGLSRSALNELILPGVNNHRPPVASISLKQPHEVRGIRLIKFSSLMAALDALLEKSEQEEVHPNEVLQTLPAKE